MCQAAKIADILLVRKDKIHLERSYNGLNSDTVNFTMEWELKIYSLSKGERINKH